MRRTFYILLACLLCQLDSYAQVFWEVINPVGTTNSYGFNAVTVGAPFGSNVSYQANVSCFQKAYRIGNNETNYVVFSFATPIEYVRLQLFAGNNGEELAVYINNVKYNIKASELSSWAGPCTAATATTTVDGVSNGNFVVISNSSAECNNSQIDIKRANISSFQISHLNGQTGGLGVRFFFKNDTFAYVNPSYNNTGLCQGSTFSLPYLVTKTHNFGNVFTAQLSDINGSFTNAVNIGSVVSTGSGVITCTIPGNTPVGTGYRIRIASSDPSKFGPDNGFDLTVGPGQQVPTVISNSPICTGSDLILNANSSTPGVAYKWTGPGLPVPSNSQKTTISNAQVNMTGKYTVYTTIMGCEAQNSVDVIVNNTPSAPAVSSNSPVCEKGTLDLKANSPGGGISYEWQGPGGVTASGGSASIPNVTPAHAGTYTAWAKIGTCKSPTSSLTVSVIPAPPQPHATASTPVCAGGDLTLNCADMPGFSFSWVGPGGFKSSSKDTVLHNVGTNASGSYIVKATQNCFNFDTVDVTVNPLPDSPKITSNTPVCDGTHMKLGATSTKDATFSWRGPNGFSSADQDPDKVVTFADSGWYYVKAILKGCPSAEAATYVNVKYSPPAPLASNSGPVKEFDSLNLYGGNICPGCSYFWVGPDSFYSSAKDTLVKDMSGDEKGTYVFSVVYDGCTTSTITLVDVIESDDKRFILYPNPNNGNFTIEGHLKLAKQFMPIAIYNELGMVIYLDYATSLKKKVKKSFSIGPTLANAVYYFVIRVDGVNKTIPFTMIR